MQKSIYGWPGRNNQDTPVPDITVYSVAGTYQWSKPSGCRWVKFVVAGGGGGGGSGALYGSTSARSGGGGGNGGGVTVFEIEADALQSSVSITVGAGGSAGAARTGASVAGGQTGGNGGNSFVGTSTNPYCGARGGSGGGGGGSGGSNGSIDNQSGTHIGGMGPLAQVQGYADSSGQYYTLVPFTPGGGPGGGYSASPIAGVVIPPGMGGQVKNAPVGDGLNNSIAFASMGGLGSALASGGNASPGGNGVYAGGGGGGGAGETTNLYASGAGGLGGDGFVIIYAYGRNSPVDVQKFSTSGTWCKPRDIGLTTARVFLLGGGGGGGSGRRSSTAENRLGGAGGSGGGVTIMDIPLNTLPDTVEVTVGLGGTGGTGITTDTTNGNFGGHGGITSLGTYAYAYGGYGGQAGFVSSSSTTGFLRGGIGVSAQGGSGAASTAGSNASQSFAFVDAGAYAVGGGAGGAIASAGTNRTGSGAAVPLVFNGLNINSTTVGVPGADVLDPLIAGTFGGPGGGGGTHAGPLDGQAGARGSGGGGGCATLNGTTSGAGGNGGNGYAFVVCF